MTINLSTLPRSRLIQRYVSAFRLFVASAAAVTPRSRARPSAVGWAVPVTGSMPSPWRRAVSIRVSLRTPRRMEADSVCHSLARLLSGCVLCLLRTLDNQTPDAVRLLRCTVSRFRRRVRHWVWIILGSDKCQSKGPKTYALICWTINQRLNVSGITFYAMPRAFYRSILRFRHILSNRYNREVKIVHV